MTMAYPFDEQGVTITQGHANAAGRRATRRCKDCGLSIPVYPGRYPVTCKNCGGEIEELTVDEQIELVKSGVPSDEVAAEATAHVSRSFLSEGDPVGDIESLIGKAKDAAGRIGSHFQKSGERIKRAAEKTKKDREDIAARKAARGEKAAGDKAGKTGKGVEKAKGDVEAAKAKDTEHRGNVAKAKADVDASKAKIASAKDALKAHQSRVKELTAKLRNNKNSKSAKDDLDAAKRSIEKTKKRIADLTASHASVTAAHNTATATHKKAQDAHKAAKDRHKAAQAAHVAATDKHKAAIAARDALEKGGDGKGKKKTKKESFMRNPFALQESAIKRMLAEMIRADGHGSLLAVRSRLRCHPQALRNFVESKQDEWGVILSGDRVYARNPGSRING
jgi:hypothetical protein